MICKKCKKDFYAETFKRIYCSNTCRALSQKKRITTTSKKYSQTRVKNYREHLLWRNYWAMYQRGWVTLSDMKANMRERYVSNKNYDKYDLFVPSNLCLD